MRQSLRVVAVTVLTLLLSAHSFVGSTPLEAIDRGAVHYGPECGFSADIDGFAFSYCFQNVVTPSANAIAHFHGDLVSEPPERATTVRGFLCSASYQDMSGFTTDTRIVVSPDGRVNGSCKFHPE